MITVDRYMAWFYVDIHGQRLEFVLNDAAKSNDQDWGYYATQLASMLDAEFKPDRDTGIQESQEYGDVSFLVMAPSPTELTDALSRCEMVVMAWINRFNVDKMKEDR